MLYIKNAVIVREHCVLASKKNLTKHLHWCRVVIGGVIAVATRAIFKPLSYLTACYLLNANASKLREEANDINNKKKLIAELSYKVMAGGCQ